MFYNKLLVRLPAALGIYMLLIGLTIAEEKDLTPAQAKAYYTIEVAKQITWPNEESFDQFVVGIIGSNPELNKAFNNYQLTKLRGKIFLFENINSDNPSPERFSIIFATNKIRSQNSRIFARFSKSLIITDGRINRKEQMISFITTGSQMKIRLNRDNISARGFDISVNLLLFAGTKKDLSEQLRETETYLKDLLTEEQQKEKNIEELNNILNEKTALLQSANKELELNQQVAEKNKRELSSLKENLETSKSSMSKNEEYITRKESLLKEKQNEIISKKQAMTKLQQRIDKNIVVLQGQVSEIEVQDRIMKNKDQTIEAQRDWLTLILVISIVFFVMIYFLLKTNSLRKQANNKLYLLNSQLFELATTDSMTGLFNRRHFLETSQKELLRQQRNRFQSVLLMIDIDHFKKVNDRHGHAAGDAVIKSVANILKINMRKYDLIGRFGGEEYVMMLVDCNIDLSYEIAQRMCKHVAEQTIYFQEINIDVTVSIGLSQLDKEDNQIEQTIFRADTALYQAKDRGRNQVVTFREKV